MMRSSRLVILRIIAGSGILNGVLNIFMLSFSSESTDACFVAVLGHISVTVRSPWPERSA